MSDEWVETTLGDHFDFIRGISYKSSQLRDVVDENNRPMVNLKCVERGGGYRQVGLKFYEGPVKESHEAESGSLLIACTDLTRAREVVGAPMLVPSELHRAVFSLDLVLLKPSSDSVLIPFAHLLLQTEKCRTYMQAHSSGTTVIHLKTKEVPDFSFALPPLPVQRRIVDLMTHLDAHIANLRAEGAALGLAASAFRTHLLSDSSEWMTARLSDLAQVQLGRMLSKERAIQGDLAPYIRNANVQWDGLDLSDLKQMDFPANERAKYALRAGDILTCEGGDPGRSVRLETDVPGIFYQKAVHRVRVLSPELESAYLYEWLVDAYQTGRIADLCTNTTIAHLTAEKFKSLVVHYPTISTQKHIAELLRDVRRESLSLRNEIESLVQFRGILLASLVGNDLTPDIALDSLIEVA